MTEVVCPEGMDSISYERNWKFFWQEKKNTLTKNNLVVYMLLDGLILHSSYIWNEIFIL